MPKVVKNVVLDLPPDVTLQRVIRGFKLGVNRVCAEARDGERVRVFEKGMYDSLVFDREHLAREKRVLHEVVAQGARAIRLTHQHFGERYKPGGMLFDLCCEGRLLEVSVAGAFARYARLDRAACLRLNEVTGELATTHWSNPGE